MKLLSNATIGLAAIVASALSGAGCSSDREIIQTAEQAGLRQATVTSSGYHYQYLCKDGEKAYLVEGENSLGQFGEEIVCCNYIWGGCTRRYAEDE